jgi:Domain of unknown function (DUF4258)
VISPLPSRERRPRNARVVRAGGGMSETLRRVQTLVLSGEVEVSRHGLQELAADGILIEDAIADITNAKAIEDYPDFHKGPSVLVFQRDGSGQPLHVLWGIERGTDTPAVLVTAYRPDPRRWSEDFTRRRE